MKMQLACIPCSLRQALEAAEKATDNLELQTRIMDECIKLTSDYKSYSSSPALARDIHEVVKKYTGISDPYETDKQAAIDAAVREYERILDFIKEKGDIYWAIKASAAGNNIDMALCGDIDVGDIMEKQLNEEFAVCDDALFREKLKSAKTLLIIGDNSGESVFDCALIESLPPMEVIYAVKSAPIINDVTEKDAISSGLHRVSRIVPSGSTVPGTILSECTEEFRSIFRKADIVISKGQGNFETIEDAGRGVFFLLRAKCRYVADALGVPLGSYVFKYIER